MPPRWCASSVSRDMAAPKNAGNFWKANSVVKLFPFVRRRASQQSMPFHFPIRHPINRWMSFALTNQDWCFSLALTSEMPWLTVKYNNIKQRANRPRTLSHVSLLLRFQQFFPKWRLHERNLWKYGREEILGFICVVVRCLSRQDYCQLDVSFPFLVHFPFIEIKNRSFSNLMDKYLSGGGIADVFSFLPCFEGGWEFRRSAPEAMAIWRLVTEFLACPRSKWACANLSRTSSRLSGAAQTWESPSVRNSLKKNAGTVPSQIPRQSSVRLLT